MRRRFRRGVAAVLLVACATIGGSLPVGTGEVAAAAEQLPTTTTLSATASQVGAFDPIYLLAVVRKTPVDGGEVSLYRHSTLVMVRQLSPNGAANFALPAGLPPGTHRFVATFDGTAGSAPSTSEAVDVVVVEDRATTTITLVSDNSPTLRGTPAELTVTMSPDPGPGTITLRTADNLVTVASAANAPGGVTAIAFTPLSLASYDYQLEACFEGNTEYRAGCSPSIVHSTWGYATTTTLTIEPATAYPDESVTFSVTVSPAPETETTVWVGTSDQDQRIPVGVSAPTGHGEVTLTPYLLGYHFAVGTSSGLRAYFPRSLQFDPSVSDVVPFLIRLDEPTLVATVDASGQHVGEEITFSASVAPLPVVESAGVGFSVTGPAASGFGDHVGVELGLDGTGATTVDTDGWPAGEYWWEAACCGDPHLAPTTQRGAFTLIDDDAPAGDISVAEGQSFVASAAVVANVVATDGVGSGVQVVALSNDGSTWATMPYADEVDWTLADGEGVRTVRARWQDQAGNWSAVKTDTIVLDTSAPTVTAPRRGFAPGTAISGSAIALRVPWSGDDTGSGIARYELAQQTDGGAWTTVARTITPSSTRWLSTERTYRFRVRATDKAGNTSAWVYGDTFRVSRYSENNSRVTFGGTWSTVSGPEFWGGAAKRSTTTGSTASLTFTGRSVAWIAPTGPDRGAAAVYVNGSKVATVDLYSPTPASRRLAWVGSWTTAASRTITIKVLGTAGRPLVDFDAFVTAD